MKEQEFVEITEGTKIVCVSSEGWFGGTSMYDELEDVPEFEVGMEFFVVRGYLNKLDPSLVEMGTILIADAVENYTWKQPIAGMFMDDFDIVEGGDE